MRVRPLSKLTRPLLLLLKLDLAITVLAVAGGIYGFIEYSSLPPGLDPDEVLLTSDLVNGLIGLGQVILAIVLGVFFLRWIYRVNQNLHVLSERPLEFTPGWAVGWYFIPFANLYKPFQVMKEIWIVAHRGESPERSLLNQWWTLWIISQFLGRLAFRIALRAEGREGQTLSNLSFIVSDGFDVALIVVALMLVDRIASAYARNFAETAPLLGPDPNIVRAASQANN